MRKINLMIAVAAGMLLTISCNKENLKPSESYLSQSSLMTKSYEQKSPKMIVYVETNDVNPLNALDYKMSNQTFIDVVNLFAANIHKVNNEPVLTLNDKLSPILENDGVATYVEPLQNSGIKVLLTILGDHQKLGVANMNAIQQKQFVNELLYAYYKYGLDGLDFDDEYADYPLFSNVSTSYSNIITLLRDKLPQESLISVFDWGKTNQLNSAALNAIDHAAHGYFQSWKSNGESRISGMPVSKWSPMSWNLGVGVDNNLTDVESYARDAKNGGYGSMMCFNLRTLSERSSLPEFQAISKGAYSNASVTCNGGNRARANAGTWFNIDPAMAKAWLIQNNYPYYDVQ